MNSNSSKLAVLLGVALVAVLLFTSNQKQQRVVDDNRTSTESPAAVVRGGGTSIFGSPDPNAPIPPPLAPEFMAPFRPFPGLSPTPQAIVREERLRYREGVTSGKELVRSLVAAGLSDTVSEKVLEAEIAGAKLYAAPFSFGKEEEYDNALSAYKRSEKEARRLARQSMTVTQRLDEIGQLLEDILDELDGVQDRFSDVERQMGKLTP